MRVLGVLFLALLAAPSALTQGNVSDIAFLLLTRYAAVRQKSKKIDAIPVFYVFFLFVCRWTQGKSDRVPSFAAGRSAEPVRIQFRRCAAHQDLHPRLERKPARGLTHSRR